LLCGLVVVSPRWRVARAGLVSGQNNCKTRGALGSSLARRLREAAGEFLKAAQVARARICGAKVVFWSSLSKPEFKFMHDNARPWRSCQSS
jgi:hypothetical protein